MDKLGAKLVADIIGCSISTLYKATSVPPQRAMPRITFSQVVELATQLNMLVISPDGKAAGEHFSVVLRSAGRSAPRGADVHEAMTRATADIGDLARAISVTRRQGPRLSRDELSAIAEIARRATDSVGAVVTAAEHGIRPGLSSPGPDDPPGPPSRPDRQN